MIQPNAPTASSRPIHRLIAIYAESHRHPVNEVIHCVCVPAIVLSALGLFWAIHAALACALAIAALLYYFSLSIPLAVGMVMMLAAMLGILALIPPGAVLSSSLVLFVLAWIGQFIGHKIEGKKPSFFDDLKFLLIGPLFVLSLLYRRCGIAF